MRMTINNQTGVALVVSNVTVWWNYDLGRGGGNGDLQLNNAASTALSSGQVLRRRPHTQSLPLQRSASQPDPPRFLSIQIQLRQPERYGTHPYHLLHTRLRISGLRQLEHIIAPAAMQK